jgi:hypothetical protein
MIPILSPINQVTSESPIFLRSVLILFSPFKGSLPTDLSRKRYFQVQYYTSSLIRDAVYLKNGSGEGIFKISLSWTSKE